MQNKKTYNKYLSTFSFFSTLLFLLLSFVPLPSYAISNVLSDEEVLGVNCNDTLTTVCLSKLSIKQLTWRTVEYQCSTTTSAPDCVPAFKKFVYSTDPVGALIYQNMRLMAITASNTVSRRMVGYNSCTYSAASSTASCVDQWEKKDANGNWIPDFSPLIQALHPWAGVRTCGTGNYYIWGEGCTTSASLRPPLTGPSNCDACRPGDSKYGFMDQSPKLAASGGNGSIGYTDVNNGARIESRTDISFPIPFIRTYSSQLYNTQLYIAKPLGFKSTHNYNKSVSIYYADLSLTSILGITFILENNDQVYFDYNATTNSFTPTFPDHKGYSAAQIDSTNFSLKTPSGNTEYYEVVPTEARGKIKKIEFLKGGYYQFTYNSFGQLTSIDDQYNRWLHFFYSDYANVIEGVNSSSGMTVWYSYTNGYLTQSNYFMTDIGKYQYSYDIAGNMVSKTDAKGNIIQLFAYDTQNRVIESKEPISSSSYVNQFTMSYSPTATTATLPDGATASYNLTVQNLFPKTSSSNIGSGQKVRSVSFDANGNPKSRANSTFDLSNNMLSSTTYEGLTRNYNWDTTKKVINSYTESNSSFSRTYNFTYDSNGNMTKKEISSGGNTRAWNYTYGTFGKVLTITEPNGSITTLTYYPDNHPVLYMRGQPQTITNGAGHTTTITAYSSSGKPTYIQYPGGREITKTYDNYGRLLSDNTLEQIFFWNNYEYDVNSNLTKATLTNGYIVNMTYDNAQRLSGITDNRGNSMAYGYDANGNIINETETSGGTTTSVKNRIFDSISRMTKESRDSGSLPYEYTYNNDDLVTKIKSPDGFDTNYYYTFRQLEGISNTGTLVGETYTKDKDGNITSISQNGNITSFTYNAFGERLTQTSPDSGYHMYSNSVVGKTKTETDASGAVLTTTYDNIGRPLTSPGNLALAIPGGDITYTWDTVVPGKVSKIAIPALGAELNYAYYSNTSALYAKTTKMNPFPNKTINYDYLGGRLNGLTYPSGTEVQYVYTKGVVTAVKINSATLLDQVQYKGFSSQPISWTWAGGQTRTMGLTASDKLTSLSDSTVLNQTIVQNDMGKIMGITDTITPSNSFSAFYNGNTKVQLSSIYKPTSGETLTYDNDTRFNLTSAYSSIVGKPYKSFTQGYNSNKIVSATRSDSTSSSTTTPTYDAKGNMLTDGLGNTYTYDQLNNLMGHTKTGSPWMASYMYNGLGQRTVKSLLNMSVFSAQNTMFIYNETGQLIGEYDATGAPIAEHVYFGSIPVAVIKGGQIYKVHTDYLGTPRVITNSSGTVVWKWENQDAYGTNLPNDTISGTLFEYNLRFPGQYFDKESGLHYNNRRTYNPETGRYLQPDPIGVAGGMNTYAYVENDPINASDPSGLDILDLLPSGDYIKGAVWTMTDSKNILRVVSHGSNSGMAGGLTAQEMIEKIKDTAYYKRRMAAKEDLIIFLDACDVGEKLYAQSISQLLYEEGIQNIVLGATKDTVVASAQIAADAIFGAMELPSPNVKYLAFSVGFSRELKTGEWGVFNQYKNGEHNWSYFSSEFFYGRHGGIF